MGFSLLLYFLALLAVFAGPSALALSPVTYSFMTLGHLLTFLASVVLFVLTGRMLRKRGRMPFWPACWMGAAAAFSGTLISQYVIRLPLAERAFIAQLHGVPVAAAETMLHLHVISGALLTGLYAAVFYAVLGGFAAWWGARPIGKTPPAKGGALPQKDPQAS